MNTTQQCDFCKRDMEGGKRPFHKECYGEAVSIFAEYSGLIEENRRLKDIANIQPMFLEFCDKHGWTWIMHRITEWDNCGAIELQMESGAGRLIKVISSTPSEAQERAILEASQVEL